MRALLYHDVAPREEWHATGFEGGDAAVYKFEHPISSVTSMHLQAPAGHPHSLRLRRRTTG